MQYPFLFFQQELLMILSRSEWFFYEKHPNFV